MSEQDAGARKPRVHGLGGVFFKARDPAALGAWYKRHLDLDVQDWGGALFHWKRADNDGNACTVFAPFGQDSQYFQPSDKPYMFNLRVDDLQGTLQALREEGCTVLDRYEESEQGKFGYALDPEGGLLELWQPAPGY
ncbi:VOC family protein [Lysobacter silvisoli]|uniref:VOC family protein n=1 Tax=Lysobacter silvisoli TaxID=2293254 RepID=A0A371JZ46_9GAMM|nr:VOC family protein [Lysobacter silvisoli]RDZ26943.1 VOC family protein [Lysobacter silvisoli]